MNTEATVAPAASVRKIQHHRLRMTRLSVVNFALQTGILALYAATGSIGWAVVLAFFVASVGHSTAFWLAIRSNWNLRLREPGMLNAQIWTSWIVQVAFMVVAPNLSVIFLVCLLVGYNAAMIAFDRRQFLTASILLGAGTALTLVLGGERAGYPGASPADRAILWLFFFLCIYRVSAIGAQYSTLRAKLSEKNTQLAQSLARIEELASHDDLTGAFNRRTFMSRLAAECARAQRAGLPFCVAIFDIDHFKQVNDSHGHPTGDAVLKAFSATAEGVVRASDLFARYGGEEFIALLTMPTDREAAWRAAERVRAAVEARDWSGMTPGRRITVSAGVACYRRDDTPETLVSRADAALYRAKSEGRNRVVMDEAR